MWKPAASTNSSPRRISPKSNKPAAIAELERYIKIGGRDPSTLEVAGQRLTGRRQQAGSRRGAGPRELYLSHGRTEHQQLGLLWLDLNNTAGAIREFQAVLARDPIDPAQAHYDLARAYVQNHQPEQAKDELIACLEVAAGFRPAQKLLLELSGPDKETPDAPVKKRE